MNDLILGNTIHDWAIALGGVLLATIAVTLLRGMIVQRVEVIAAHTDTLADDALVVLLRSVRKTYVTILALCIAELWLAFEPPSTCSNASPLWSPSCKASARPTC